MNRIKCHWEKNTYVCDTQRSSWGNEGNIKYLKKGESIYYRKGQVLVQVWQNRRETQHIATLHTAKFVETEKEKGSVERWRSKKLKSITGVSEMCIRQTKFFTTTHAAGKPWNELRSLCSFSYIWLPWTVSHCSKNTPQTKIKRAKAMLSRTSHLTVFRKWQSQRREKTRKIVQMMNH